MLNESFVLDTPTGFVVSFDASSGFTDVELIIECFKRVFLGCRLMNGDKIIFLYAMCDALQYRDAMAPKCEERQEVNGFLKLVCSLNGATIIV